MKIENSRELADKVWRVVKKTLASKEKCKEAYVTLQSYQNGREQGHALNLSNYKLKLSSAWIGWAENRNSDNIVVYIDDHDPLQSVNEESYKKRKLFEDVEDAAKYIVGFVMNIVR